MGIFNGGWSGAARNFWAAHRNQVAAAAAAYATAGAASAMNVGVAGLNAGGAAAIGAGVGVGGMVGGALAPKPETDDGGDDTLLSPPNAAAAKADNPDIAAKNARDRARLLAGGREGTKKSTLGSTGGNYAPTSLLGG